MRTIDVRGARMPVLGLGTWQMSGEACRRAVAEALELGYRHIDTAQAYGNEREVGEAVRASGIQRDQVWITTKVWYEHLDRGGVRSSTQASLERLGFDSVDLLLIHWPNPRFPLKETLAAMSELAEEGRVRYFGVSNFPPSLTGEAAELAPILCNQVEMHPFLQQERLFELGRQRELIITAYCPLARGKVARDEILRGIAERHGKTPAQVALRWLLDHPFVSAVPKASSRDHIRENLEVFDFELTDEDRERIARLDRGLRLIDPEWAPDWER